MISIASSGAALARGGDCVDPVSPPLECGAHFVLVASTVVNSGYARLVAADVVQDRFDDVGEDAEFGHHGGGCAPQIMKAPFGHAIKLEVEAGLRITPTLPGPSKYKFIALGLTLNNRANLR